MIIDKVLSLIAPHVCLACGREGALVCQPCLSKSVGPRRSTCWLCNRLTDDHRVCGSCRHQTKMLRVVVASHYEGVVKELVGLLKYHNNVAAARVCADLLVPHVQGNRFDLVTAVPAVTSRLRERGYNQAELIAKHMARSLQLPYLALLGRTGQQRQVGKPRQKRLEQVEATIYPKRKYAIRGQRILIVDDVLTTGATINECARVLRRTGAKRVEGAVVAKH